MVRRRAGGERREAGEGGLGGRVWRRRRRCGVAPSHFLALEAHPDFFREASVFSYLYGENIARSVSRVGAPVPSLEESIRAHIEQWIHSPPHYGNMINPGFNRVGCAMVHNCKSPTNANFVVHMSVCVLFGSDLDVAMLEKSINRRYEVALAAVKLRQLAANEPRAKGPRAPLLASSSPSRGKQARTYQAK